MQRQGSNAGVVLEARQQPGSVMPIVRVLRISGSSWVVDMGEGGGPRRGSTDPGDVMIVPFRGGEGGGDRGPDGPGRRAKLVILMSMA